MGTPSLFDATLKHEANFHAAWLPITNTFQVGDYGLFSDGVFAKMGNIRTFGANWSEADGPLSKIDFTSDGTIMTRLVGDAKVNAFPTAPVDASLKIEFSRESSFLIKAQLTSREIQSIDDVARWLSSKPNWESRNCVVSAIYIGQQCTILSSKGANSSIVLTGKADALKQLDLASASAGIEIGATDKIGLQIVAATGVIGLSLFKLRWIGGIKVMGQDEDKARFEIEKSANGTKFDDDV